ncbi:2',3'-cyclic-nucleotide 2'-phosphodiesterase / 3'-nucleotidase / 5'-nucleotidase [Gracilibacillus orientalis]|uniref:2',3'-cyclic-nucleotide 2'-phosphodiesterase / 3'-nucleotidase / 5'-nucleotidase n=1 Tax=Gracilibacillus orientalis TaxID=334253 RepID=A0A1I4IVF6_9BACI|nr:5'-nucleotidase C-terminal domain-containing protein [Gracilibacillus orientalis]SFL58285.1 2',3'-cyclic-nucleotide 2'-phosphodiesterase / 3'-nucleotidase / 5'-nucleotidase [Gracilibacillus orientalis]
MTSNKCFDFSLRMFVIFVVALTIVLPTSTLAAEDDSEDFSLTIMHMNDTHAHVEPLPNMLTAIKEVRAENPEALLLHAGDVFSGTLYFNRFKGQADLSLLNMMDFDAMVFGNHEFDLGSGEDGHQSLAEFVTAADFPFLGTNVDFSADQFMSDNINADAFTDSPDNGSVYDGMIKEINGEKVGIFGMTTEDTANISSPVNVKFLNYIAEAERAVSAFEERGVDKIIALNHIGYDSNPDMGNDIQLAANVDGIDVIVGGHSHTRLDEPTFITEDAEGNEKDPTVIVQAHQYAQLLGTLDVEFDENGVVVGHAGQLIEVSEKEADPEAVEVLTSYKGEVDELTNQDTGAMAMKDIPNPRLGDSDVSVRANETELGNLITDAMLAKAKEKNQDIVIALQNGGGIRAAIDEGPITVGEVIAVLPFGNDPVVAELTGAEIKEILEHGVRQAPAESGGFLQVAGMKFNYDSTKEPGSRIVTMEVAVDREYEDVVLEETYLVTTNNFTGKGGDGFDVFAQAYDEGRVRDIGEIDWEQLRDYMVEDLNGEVNPVIEDRIIDLLGEEPGEQEQPEEDNNDDGTQDDTNEEGSEDETDNGKETDNDGSKDEQDNENTDEETNNQGSEDKEDKVDSEKESDKEVSEDSNNEANSGDENNQEKGERLPDTATNMYTFLLFGGIILIIGMGVLVYRKVKLS